MAMREAASSRAGSEGYILAVKDLRKHFGGVRALDGVSFSLRPGEVHALVGENGAGKSTLIKVLSGAFGFDAGTIELDGTDYRPAGPQAAKASGIQVVHQEFNLLNHLSVAENVSIEAMPRTRLGLLDRREMNRRARASLNRIGLTDIDVRASVRSLGVAHRQLVEIARALQSESRILILDEPTATLTERETTRLFEIVAEIKAQGVTVVFVTHHLNEVFVTCDRVTIFRSGKTIATEAVADTTPERVVRHMVGRELEAERGAGGQGREPGTVALALRGLRVQSDPHPEGITIDLCYGEIVGIAGLVGAGRTELLRGIFGVDDVLSGHVERDGAKVRLHGPRDAIAAGIAFVTEDRKEEGLILDMPIAANVSLADMGAVSRRGLMRFDRERHRAQELREKLRIKCGAVTDPASSMSGGNQQKVVLAKWLACAPAVLILDEPTRGVDVGAKAEIYAILRDLVRGGAAMLIVSSEMPELMTLCDRIHVMADHRFAGTLDRADFSGEAILGLAYNRNGTRRGVAI